MDDHDDHHEELDYSCRGGHRDVYRWFTGHDPAEDRMYALLGLIGRQQEAFEHENSPKPGRTMVSIPPSD